MRRLILKSLLFLSPFAVLLGLELFVLPLDCFTFRVFESVIVRKYRNLLPGPFYPCVEVSKEEEGDLAHHTEFSRPKKVEWYLDRYGYRKRDTGRDDYEIVIVGDSNIFGSSLTQEDILSEVLERKTGTSAYPLSPAGLNTFLKDRRFRDHPPKIVILSSMEREILDLPSLKISREKTRPGLRSRIDDMTARFERRIKGDPLIQSAGVFLDRIHKMNMLHSLRADLRRFFAPPPFGRKSILSSDGPIFFLEGARANMRVPKDRFENVVQVIKTYDRFMKSKGLRFIFVPVPNKENIYHEQLHTERPFFLEELTQALNTAGIETVDTQSAFEEAFRKESALLYQTDDTHWSEAGVRLTADLIISLINSKP